MKSAVVCFAVVAVFGVVFSSSAGASQGDSRPAESSPRSEAYLPRWNQVPTVTLPERAQFKQTLVDQDGLVHVFFSVNEGLNVPQSVNVVSWRGTGWGPVTELGPIASWDSPRHSGELSAGIPTVGWTNYGTMWLARYDDGVWSTTSADVPGYDPSDPRAKQIWVRAVGTAANGTSTGLIGVSCSVTPDTPGCAWIVSWPASQSNATVTSVGSMGGVGLRYYWVNDSGDVEALYTSSSQGPNLEIWNSKHRGGEWRDKTLVASPIISSVESLKLSVVRSGDRIVAAWRQMDPQYGETIQVGSAQRVDGVWSTPEVLASGFLFAGLSVGAEGLVCLRYVKVVGWGKLGFFTARTLTDGSWSAPVSLSSPGSTSSNNAPCLFRVFDSEFAPMALLGVTASSVFFAPEAPGGWFVGVRAGVVWNLQVTGTSLSAARLAFSQASPPSAPTAPKARSLKRAVKFSWAAPTTPGAGPLTYEYRVRAAAWVRTTRPFVKIKAPKGKRLTISVRAVNASGAGGSITISGKAK